jgi:hypothetical protein
MVAQWAVHRAQYPRIVDVSFDAWIALVIGRLEDTAKRLSSKDQAPVWHISDWEGKLANELKNVYTLRTLFLLFQLR